MAAAGRELPNYFRQSFTTASRLFKSIDAPTQGVIVPYAAGAELIADLCAAYEVETQFDLLRLAQQFSVNVFPSVLLRLQAQTALHEVQKGTGILHLDSRFYDAEFGLSESTVSPMEMHYV
jgi:CRISPR-associated endonuclease/helicase Cas3